MDTRKLTLVPMNVKGFPDADLAYAAYPDGSTAIGAAPTEDQEELVRRWNAHQVMHDALVEIATIQESSNTWDPEDIGKALDNAVATAQGALRALKQDAQEDTQRTFSILIAYPDKSPWFGTASGESVEEAIEDARRQINKDNRSQYSDDELEVLAVIAGEHQDLKP